MNWRGSVGPSSLNYLCSARESGLPLALPSSRDSLVAVKVPYAWRKPAKRVANSSANDIDTLPYIRTVHHLLVLLHYCHVVVLL